MAQAPSFFQNSPVAGTQYWAPMWAGCIPNSGTTFDCHVRAWSGANGTGSLVTVTSLTAFDWDQTTNASKNSFTGSSVNAVNATTTQTNGSDWFKPSGKRTGTQTVGSLELFCIYTGTAWIPTTPSLSQSSGAPGDSITITGSRFTDATFVNFNGVGASFSVVNDTTITATVPSGATTGPVTVGNPAGTSPNSATFTVIHAYVRRSGVWVPAPVYVRRSGVWHEATGVSVRRSGAWTPGG